MKDSRFVTLDETKAVDRTLRRERVKYMRVQSSLSMFLSPLAGVILSVAVWNDVAWEKLLVFNLGLILTAFVRLRVHGLIPKSVESDSAVTLWERVLVLAIFFSALWWGVGGVFLMADASKETGLIVFTVLMMLSCAGSLRYAVHKPAAFILPLTMAFPVTLIFARSSEQTQLALALGSLFFISSILHAIDRIGKLFTKTHTLTRKLESERTEVLRVNIQLEESYRELERLESLRDTLTQMIIHDLRAPLAGSAFYVALARDAVAEENQEEGFEHLAHLESLLGQVGNMIENILDVSRLEHNTLRLILEEHELPEMVKEVLKKLGPAGGRIRTEGVDAVRLSCDGELISRVVLNLLSNALAFSPPEEPVDLQVVERGDSVEFSVMDRGAGIPAGMELGIFQKFAHGDTHPSHRRSKGLGLAFCKLVVETHGGRIGVASLPGAPTRFWFQIPREPGLAKPSRKVKDSPPPTPPRRWK